MIAFLAICLAFACGYFVAERSMKATPKAALAAV